MTVAELGERMSSREFMEWAVFERLEAEAQRPNGSAGDEDDEED